MDTNILVTVSALSDQDLLARLELLAGKEREASAELVAHLAALDSRPSLYAAQGYGSLFSYCTQALRLSEDAACNRIEAARACRHFPLILELLASGSLTLTSVRLLGRHLTAENHVSVLERARDRRRHEIEVLVAELAPRPDVPSAVRKLPCTRRQTPPPLSAPEPAALPGPDQSSGHGVVQLSGPGLATISVPSPRGIAIAPSPSALPVTPRPIIQASAPARKPCAVHHRPGGPREAAAIAGPSPPRDPDGDPGAIFDRALTVLLEKVEQAKLGAATKPRPNRPIRPGTDRKVSTDKEMGKPDAPFSHVPPARPSRTVPREVKREVWRRDGGQCAFESATGRRCTERAFLEFHHVQPYAKQGPATIANISLRCWRHNQYEAELIFGPYASAIVREAGQSGDPAWTGPSRTIDSSVR